MPPPAAPCEADLEPLGATQDMGLEPDERDEETLDELRRDLFSIDAAKVGEMASFVAHAPQAAATAPTAPAATAPTAAPRPDEAAAASARRASSRVAKPTTRFEAGPSGSMDSRLGSRHVKVFEHSSAEIDMLYEQWEAERERRHEAQNQQLLRENAELRQQADQNLRLQQELCARVRARRRTLTPRRGRPLRRGGPPRLPLAPLVPRLPLAPPALCLLPAPLRTAAVLPAGGRGGRGRGRGRGRARGRGRSRGR